MFIVLKIAERKFMCYHFHVTNFHNLTMNAYSKTISWWKSKAHENDRWEKLSEEQKIQIAWDASLSLRADIIDVSALQWAYSKIEELYNEETDEMKKRVLNIYLDRLEKMKLACMAFK